MDRGYSVCARAPPHPTPTRVQQNRLQVKLYIYEKYELGGINYLKFIIYYSELCSYSSIIENYCSYS